ncbi:hypothetical protein [Dyella sp. GSA-30]|uniref:helix-turn-helix transcriptional regulator n=1 Tax=Dyella sp. GSA-30 TaxID=2994496 RepID=UPI00248FD699|nr:hypothetical protein [Dyella sp. GSA-30]BDU22038.1 hypothetical protein DYGSA30_34950 [Dyella sp. GSA-30]
MSEARQLLKHLQAQVDGRADATESMLLTAVRNAGYWISADRRIGEADLAVLLGITPGGLANKRRDGSAPPFYVLGGAGHRVTYRLAEVAAWIEAHREDG